MVLISNNLDKIKGLKRLYPNRRAIGALLLTLPAHPSAKNLTKLPVRFFIDHSASQSLMAAAAEGPLAEYPVESPAQ